MGQWEEEEDSPANQLAYSSPNHSQPLPAMSGGENEERKEVPVYIIINYT